VCWSYAVTNTIWQRPLHLPRYLEAGQPRHLDVEEKDIGCMRFDLPQGRDAVAGLRDDVELRQRANSSASSSRSSGSSSAMMARGLGSTSFRRYVRMQRAPSPAARVAYIAI